MPSMYILRLKSNSYKTKRNASYNGSNHINVSYNRGNRGNGMEWNGMALLGIG